MKRKNNYSTSIAGSSTAPVFAGISQSEIDDIRQIQSEILAAVKMTIDKVIDAGGKLSAIRAKLKHGQWMPFVKHVGISDQTARNYIRVWEHRHTLKSQNILNLTEAYAATLPAPKKVNPADERMQHALRLEEFINSLVRVTKMVLHDWQKPYGDGEERLMLKIECGLRREWWIKPTEEVENDYVIWPFFLCGYVSKTGASPDCDRFGMLIYTNRNSSKSTSQSRP